MSETSTNLLIFIDITGSMGEWIRAVNKFLPLTIKSIALTQLFNKIGIMTYSDYDQDLKNICKFSGLYDTLKTDEIASLQKFATEMRPIGGGGAPEAVKTALLEIEKLKIDGKIYIIHLTDAPPHCITNLDHEGKKEKNQLGKNFDWIVVTNKLLAKYSNLRYTCLTTCTHQFYCHLAEMTGGDVHRLTGGVSSSNIQTQLGRIINGWLSLDNPLEERSSIEMSNFSSEKDIIKETIQPVKGTGTPCKQLSASLLKAIRRMKKDELFIEHTINEFKTIISEKCLKV